MPPANPGLWDGIPLGFGDELRGWRLVGGAVWWCGGVAVGVDRKLLLKGPGRVGARRGAGTGCEGGWLESSSVRLGSKTGYCHRMSSMGGNV